MCVWEEVPLKTIPAPIRVETVVPESYVLKFTMLVEVMKEIYANRPGVFVYSFILA